MPPNVAQIALAANPSALSTGLNAAYKMVANFTKLSAQALQSLHLAPQVPKNGNGFSVARAALGTAVGMYTKRGIDLLVDQGKQIFEFNDQLVRFGIAARIGGSQLEWVGRAARLVAAETGVASLEVLRGARAYVDMAGASAFTADKMSLLAHVAQASKADIGDLSQVMFQLQHSMKVSDADLENTFGGVINMSKDGAVHFAQMAQEIAELAPQAARFGMTGREGVNQLTALMQVARTGFGSVSEMGTGITRVFAGLTMHADKFEKYGVKIFNVGHDGTKTWRKFSDIFADIQKNNLLGKDPFLLRKAFGRSEADRTIRLWFEGIDALKQLENAGRANGVVQQDLATYSESAAGRMQIAMEKLKNAVAEAFTPERIQKFVSAIEDLGSKLGPVAEAVGKIGDGIGWIYSLGKKMRGWMGNHGEMKAFFDPTEIEAYRKAKGYANGPPNKFGVSEGYARAYAELIADRTETNTFIRAVGKLMPDDKTTPEALRLAIGTRARARPGTDLANAADSFINESGLSAKQVHEIAKSIAEEDVKAGAATPEGQAMLAQMADLVNNLGPSAKYLAGASTNDNFFNPPSKVDLLGALTDLTSAIRGNGPLAPLPNIMLDGNQVGKGVQESTNPRRR